MGGDPLSSRIGFLMLKEQEWEREEQNLSQGTETISVPTHSPRALQSGTVAHDGGGLK